MRYTLVAEFLEFDKISQPNWRAMALLSNEQEIGCLH